MKKRKAKRKPPRFIWTYRGVNIYRNMEPGSRLRYTAGRFAADTLAGMRELIRDDERATNA